MARSSPCLKYPARRQVIERIAPDYRQASSAQKTLLLDTVVAVTGYARKYAIGLLNHASPGQHLIRRQRLPRYGQEVQQALLVAWKAAHRVCAKRLIPFLPTLVAALERHGHLHLCEQSRSHLLSMSAATADRLLQAHRKAASRSPTITQPGPLLKDQIPIRTFHQWDETRPGFLEADLVGHHGGDIHGSFLYTLTLTDIATGWTECLPLLYKSPEAVLCALQQARTLFPFPIRGLDIDNGGEFINEPLLAYCEAEHITFTRGREGLKQDQCFIEQKNGAVVRQFVGHGRLSGISAYQQLRELYRAVRLYVNAFQPSMKLQEKYQEGEQVHRLYDPAKTPRERLLRSEIVPAEQQQELTAMSEALDPLGLLQQIERLQQALWRGAGTPLPLTQGRPVTTIQPFCLDRCLPGALPPGEREGARTILLPDDKEFLEWRRTSRDPFEGQWDLIASLVLAHPEWSGSELLQEMQRLFPGRYPARLLPSLQMGLRKIRARLLDLLKEPWPRDGLCGPVRRGAPQPPEQEREPQGPTLASPLADLPAWWQKAQAEERALALEFAPPCEEESSSSPGSPPVPAAFDGDSSTPEPVKPVPDDSVAGDDDEIDAVPPRSGMLTIAGAIQAYLEAQREAGRSSKTLEWHRIALGLFQQYLVYERHLLWLGEIIESEVRGWVTFLQTTPSRNDTARSARTIGTYARSARAFCRWLVSHGHLEHAPFGKGIVPKAGSKAIHLIELEEFERLLLAARTGGENDAGAVRAAVRNRAILWVLWDTGMGIAELRGLRLGDVDREERALRVRGKGGRERSVTLSANGWFQLLSYLEQSRPKEVYSQGEQVKEEHLFLSEWYQPLTSNALTLLFDRLQQRAGMSDKPVSPIVLRDTFAVRYLQEGGTLQALGEQLGLRDLESLKRYARPCKQRSPHEPPQELAEMQGSPSQPVAQKRKRRRRKSSSTTTRKARRRRADKLDGSAREAVHNGEDDLEVEMARQNVTRELRARRRRKRIKMQLLEKQKKE
jgi:site-specific recombinase XerD